MAFRLKPLEMSDQLIQQLRALQSQFEKQARALQELVNQGKQKMKYYQPVMEEAPRKIKKIILNGSVLQSNFGDKGFTNFKGLDNVLCIYRSS